MATYYSSYDGRQYRLRLEITQTSQSIDNNTSNISYALYLENGDFRFVNYQSEGNLIINGSTQWNLDGAYSCALSLNSEKLIKSGTMTISHNTDGTKTLLFSASFKTDVVGSYGTTTTLSINSSMALTTIPRASDPTVNYSSRALGLVLRVNTNRASTSFTHTLRWKVGSSAYTTFATSVGAYYDWTLPNEIANELSSVTSGIVTIQCLTYSGATLIGTETVNFTATIPNNATFQPTASIEMINVVDGLGAYFVQGKSKVNVLSGGAAKWGAGIAQYRVTIDGSFYYGDDITSVIINKSGSITITLRVTDTRGYYSETSNVAIFQAYYSPKINLFSASRNPAQSGTGLSVSIDFEIAPVANQNAKYHSVEYREVGATTWLTVANSTLDYFLAITYNEIAVLDATKSYEVKLELRDSYNTSSNPIVITRGISTVFKIINVNPSGQGMAIGKYSEDPNGLEIALPTDFTENPTVNNIDILGNRTYTEQNVVTSGESITNSINELDKGVIVESGSNANGNWVKWADGTMIAYRTANSNFSQLNTTYAYPVNFVGDIHVSWGVGAIGSTSHYVVLASAFVSALSSSWNFRSTQTTTTGPTTTILNFIAIGKWK